MERIALLFPGQGSQYVGMGQSLAEVYPIARQTFEEANDLLGFDLQKICLEGSLLKLSEAENLLPAMLCASVAAFRVYMKEVGLQPDCSAGHSLGELAALTCAGAIEFPDAVQIAYQRGKLAQQIQGTLTVLSGIDIETIENQCRKLSKNKLNVVVACYNSQDQVLVSGDELAVAKLEDIVLENQEAQVTPLMKSIPFHSPLMSPITALLQNELKKYLFHDFNWQVIANVTALPYEGPEQIIENFVRQIDHPVQWQGTMEYMKKAGVTVAVELGPKTVLRDIIKAQIKPVKAYSYDVPDDLRELARTRAAGEKADIDSFFIKCMAAAVCVKNRNWDQGEYHRGVVEPYRKLEKFQNELEEQKRSPEEAQMREALEMLHLIFTTKQVPGAKQSDRINRILVETGTEGRFADLKKQWGF